MVPQSNTGFLPVAQKKPPHVSLSFEKHLFSQPIARTDVQWQNLQKLLSTARLLWSSWLTVTLIIVFIFTANIFVHGAEGSSSCSSVYMAKSTIANAGWGVFAGRDYQAGDFIGTSSVAIPVIDVPSLASTSVSFGMLPEYLWESANIGGFSEARRVQLFLPGIGSLVNHHPVLDNVKPTGLRSPPPYSADNTTTTPYVGLRWIATRTIASNEELFVDYHGAMANSHHPYLASSALFPDVYGQIDRANSTINEQQSSRIVARGFPTADDYHEADRIVQSLWKLHTSANFTFSQWIDILFRIRNQELFFHPRADYIASLLPRTFQQLERASQLGIAKADLVPQSIREDYYCLDNIQIPNTSSTSSTTAVTIHDVEEGGILAVAPLVYVPNRQHFANPSSGTHLQLLENYCFGHRFANLLLCPTTHGALIRHNSREANVRIRWKESSSDGMITSNILVSPLEEYTSNVNPTDPVSYASGRSLMIEYVALKKIAAGDELWMDFGDEYELALDAHRLVERVTEQQDTRQPPPSSIFLSSHPSMHPFYKHECNLYPNMKIQAGEDHRSWEDFFTNRMSNPNNWPSQFATLYQDNAYASWYPCEVVQVNDLANECDIIVFSKGYKMEQMHLKGNEETVANVIIGRLQKCPMDRIRIVHAHYKSPLHDPLAFRSYIPISDDLYPLHWRVDYKPSSFWNLGAISESTENFDYEQSLRNVSCGLYLAESSIPNAGFGLYTAVEIPASNILIGSSLPAIVVHEPSGGWADDWVGSDYVWNGKTFSIVHDGYPDFSVSVINGLFGGLANFHTGLVNMAIYTTRTNPALDRRKDPGAGAFSDLANSSFRSVHPIAAGEELFVSYGEQWLSGRPSFKDVPLKENFHHVDRLTAALWSMLHVDGASISHAAIERLLVTIQTELVSEHRTKMAMKNVLNLPSIERVLQRNGTAKMTVSARPNEWLMNNGFCLDNIYVKDSTIPQAGKGGFARRFLKCGSVIHSSPVIAVSRRSLDNMNNFTNQTEINEKPLMLNYHFSHESSSLFLLPMTQMIALNHNRSAPNARVQFSSERNSKTRYLLQRPLDDIFAQRYSSLLIDVVATQDIPPDVEITIDYGESWDNSWNYHVENWQSPCAFKDEGKLKDKECDMNNCFESSRLVVIEMNQDRHNPRYHAWSDVHLTGCEANETHPWNGYGAEILFLTENDDDGAESGAKTGISWVLKSISYKDDGFDYPYLSLLNVLPCKIVGSNTESDTFDIIYLFQHFQVPKQHRREGNDSVRVAVLYKNLPAQEVQFLNKPLRGDAHDPRAFRHEIHLSDDVFPKLWKDLERK